MRQDREVVDVVLPDPVPRQTRGSAGWAGQADLGRVRAQLATLSP